jgi:hypothetical protein
MVLSTSCTACAVQVLACLLLLPVGAAAQSAAASQAKSGPLAVDACAVLTAAELEQALGHKVKPQRVPPTRPRAQASPSACTRRPPAARRSR